MQLIDTMYAFAKAVLSKKDPSFNQLEAILSDMLIYGTSSSVQKPILEALRLKIMDLNNSPQSKQHLVKLVEGHVSVVSVCTARESENLV